MTAQNDATSSNADQFDAPHNDDTPIDDDHSDIEPHSMAAQNDATSSNDDHSHALPDGETAHQNRLVRDLAASLEIPESFTQDSSSNLASNAIDASVSARNSVASAAKTPSSSVISVATTSQQAVASWVASLRRSMNIPRISQINNIRPSIRRFSCMCIYHLNRNKIYNLFHYLIFVRMFLDQSQREVKQEPEPIFSHFNVNTGSLQNMLSNTLNLSSSSSIHFDDNILSENITIGHEDDDSNDCVMIGEAGGEVVPLPLPSTSEGLIKIDADPISNDIPFITTVCVYLILYYFSLYLYISH